MQIGRGEADEVCGGMMIRENLFCVVRLHKDMIHFLQASKMALGKAFLIRNQDVGLCSANPSGEDTLKKEIDLKALLLREPLFERGDGAAVAGGDTVPE